MDRGPFACAACRTTVEPHAGKIQTAKMISPQPGWRLTDCDSCRAAATLLLSQAVEALKPVSWQLSEASIMPLKPTQRASHAAKMMVMGQKWATSTVLRRFRASPGDVFPGTSTRGPAAGSGTARGDGTLVPLPGMVVVEPRKTYPWLLPICAVPPLMAPNVREDPSEWDLRQSCLWAIETSCVEHQVIGHGQLSARSLFEGQDTAVSPTGRGPPADHLMRIKRLRETARCKPRNCGPLRAMKNRE